LSREIQSPRLDAELLLAHVLKVERIQLYLDPDRPVTSAERAQYRTLVRNRANRVPIAYLTGTREFWSLPIAVTRDVLIPRPETESLVRAVLERVKDMSTYMRICDMGTGSGCIAMALAQELPDAVLSCVDTSEKALNVARENARSLRLAQRMVFYHSNWFHVFETLDQKQQFDVIVSNPPYLRSGEFLYNLQPEIAVYEPRIALDGGEAGLDPYPFLAEGAMQFLNPGGILGVEIGDDQADSVSDLFQSKGLEGIEIVMDDFGTPRAIIAHRRK
jgi:release factor glutamine methyltransferase